MRPTRAEVSLSAIKHNLKQVKDRVGPGVKIMGVVKANAYGHGIIEISKFILKKYVDYLGVAILEEGILLRENGIAAPIHVFTQPFEDQLMDFIKYTIEPTVCSIEIVRYLNSLGSTNNLNIPIHVKIDTGMGRIGVPFSSAVEFIENVRTFPNIVIKSVFSHFATSDESDKTFAYLQLNRFKKIMSNLKNSTVSPIFHIANSGAIIDMKESYLDMVRPGIMMYGYNPSPIHSKSIDLEPALSLKSRISFLKTVMPGTSISYGRRYYSKRKTKIASIPIGYADGFYRALTNKGDVIIASKKFQVSGTVCMDQIMIDIGLSKNIKVGDDVLLIGQNGKSKITAWDIANKINSIPYEICCSISTRVPRIYIG